MKVRTLLPGRKIDDVAYRCEDCGEEVTHPVPREPWRPEMTGRGRLRTLADQGQDRDHEAGEKRGDAEQR
jgi:hypothetical protein